MSGMGRDDLIIDLKAMLMDAAAKFRSEEGADFARHLSVAARDMSRVRPRTLTGTLALEAGRSSYPAPAGLIRPKIGTWGFSQRRQIKPWQPGYPQDLPDLSIVETETGRQLWLEPAPTAAQISAYGANYPYFYFAAHHVDANATQTTIAEGDRALLLIRAAAAALDELAINHYTKPVQLAPGSGLPSMPRNGTPSALSAGLMNLFERMAA